MIRSAKETDIPQLILWMAALKQHVITETHDVYLESIDDNASEDIYQMFSSLILSDQSKVLVAEKDNQLVGFIYATLTEAVFQPSTINQIGRIEMCWVDAEYRKKGIAKNLVQDIEVWFKEKSIRFVDLYFIIGNTEAEMSWEKMGYIPYRTACRKEIT